MVLPRLARLEELCLVLGAELIAHVGEVKLGLLAHGVNGETDVAIIVGTEC